MKKLHEELLHEKLINNQSFKKIDAIVSRKIISLYFELRVVLYLGIMLFTGSIGYIVYQNMSNIGHLAMMLLMLLGIGVGAYFIQQKSKPYANEQVKVDAMYFDYLVVLICLLIISLFTYIQVYFELVELLIQWTSIVTAVIFMHAAYRYDNKIVLSLGITAFAAAFGLTISPVDWVNGNWQEGVQLYLISIVVGSILLVISQALDYKQIKKHFTFTYQNFGWLLFYFGGLALVLDGSKNQVIAAVLLLISLSVSIFYWRRRSFLFFIYSSLTAYILVTYLLLSIDLNEDTLFDIAIFYFPITCIAGVILLIKNKSHFSDDQ